MLRLIFLTSHPALPAPSRAALCLRLVGGLTTGEIARGFLVPEPTMGQRISRAKKTLSDAGAHLDLPTGSDRRARLADVTGVIYLIFNEGYSTTAGPQCMRPDLCHEAMRLARLLAVQLPEEPEVQGLQALLELQASRLPARVDVEGRPVLLEEQDRTRWDHLLIRRGLQALARATSTGGPIGTYTLQAEIAACHARAHRAEDTGWQRIAAWYDVLSGHAPAPSSRSTVRSRTAGRSARTPGCGYSTPSTLRRAATCSAPSEPICSTAPGGQPRPLRRSARLPQPPPTPPNAPS